MRTPDSQFVEATGYNLHINFRFLTVKFIDKTAQPADKTRRKKTLQKGNNEQCGTGIEGWGESMKTVTRLGVFYFREEVQLPTTYREPFHFRSEIINLGKGGKMLIQQKLASSDLDSDNDKKKRTTRDPAKKTTQ